MTVLICKTCFNGLNSELNVLKKIWFVGKISIRLPNGLFEKNVYTTLESCWWSLVTLLQWTNTLSVISSFSTFSLLLSLVVLFWVLRSNFFFQVLKVQDCIHFYFLNVILFSILFTYIFTDVLSISSPCFVLKYTQNNLEYLIQNSIHLVIQIYHSMLLLIF